MIKEADPEGTGHIKYADFVRLITTSYINWYIYLLILNNKLLSYIILLIYCNYIGKKYLSI